MQLNLLEIENYGLYRSRHLNFGEAGFRLIYGPNEAGKSTLLQLIRELLFGFPHQSSYAFENHNGRLAATAHVTLRDGRQVEFRRQKGRSGTVTGEFRDTREAINEEVLGAVLGTTSGTLYEQIFGFSLAELSSGEKSLQDANLNEALYGGGIGGLSGFQRVRENVRDEHSSLYSSRARKPPINALLTQIREKSRLLRESTVRPGDYDDQLQQCELQEESAEKIRAQLQLLRQRHQRLSRLEQAVGIQARRNVVQAELESLKIKKDLPPDAVSRFRQTRERAGELAEEVRQLREQITHAERTQRDLSLAPKLLEQSSAILSLAEQIARISGCLSEIPECEQVQRDLERQLQAGLRDLNPDWTVGHLEGLRLSMSRRAVLEDLSEQSTQLDQREAVLQSQRPDLDLQLAQMRQRLESLPATDQFPGLEDLIDRSQQYSSDRQQLVDLNREDRNLTIEAAQVLHSLVSSVDVGLHGNLPDVSEFSARPVPNSATVSELREQEERLRQQQEAAEHRLAEADRDIEELNEQLTAINESSTAVSRDRLETQRQARDRTWDRIRDHYVTQDVTDLPVATPEEFERMVAAADQMADERQQNAEEVARVEQLQEAIGRLEARRQQHAADVDSVARLSAELRDRWEQLWQPAGIKPLTPAGMLQWLDDFRTLRDLTSRQTRLTAQREELRQQQQGFEAELQRAFPQQESEFSTDAVLSQARRRLDELREADLDRRRLNRELPELEARSRTLDQELYQASLDRAQWQVRWNETLKEYGLPDSWTASVSLKALNSIGELMRMSEELSVVRDRAAEMRTSVERFEVDLRRVLTEASTDLGDIPAVECCRQLGERLDHARTAAAEFESSERELSRLRERLSLIEPQLESQTRELGELLASAGVADEASFLSLAKEIEQHARLTATMRDLERDVSTIAGDDSQFAKELQEVDSDLIVAQVEQLSQEIALSESQYDQSLQESAVARRRLEELDNRSRSVELAAETECLRSELATAVDRWAPLVLMEAMMDRALKDFEQNHQPRLIEEVSRLFAAITGNRYRRIRRQLEGGETLLAEDRTGMLKKPDELSTGTREQLYLAIRLAFVLQYCESSEPLPIVMDDVLVNFDRVRTRQTLEALLKLSEDVQILFLTCHDHMVQLVRELAPENAPLLLTPDRPVDGGAPVADQPVSAVQSRRPRRSSRRKESDDQPGLFPAG